MFGVVHVINLYLHIHNLKMIENKELCCSVALQQPLNQQPEDSSSSDQTVSSSDLSEVNGVTAAER